MYLRLMRKLRSSIGSIDFYRPLHHQVVKSSQHTNNFLTFRWNRLERYQSCDFHFFNYLISSNSDIINVNENSPTMDKLGSMGLFQYIFQ